jgi:hypothetical protein
MSLVNVCVCMQTDRQTDSERQTDRQAGRQAGRQRQAHRAGQEGRDRLKHYKNSRDHLKNIIYTM